MSKQLLLLRHAKSDWGVDFKSDFLRPLNKRGKRDAQLIGHWIAKQDLLPDLILCSPAIRARETLEHVLSHFEDENITTEFPKVLYHADLNSLLKTIHRIPKSVSRPLIIGHNAEIEELAQYLSNAPLPYTENNKLLTTANLVLFGGVNHFHEIQQHNLNLVSLTRPKELRSQF